MSNYPYFKPLKQPSVVDDRYHVFDFPNALNILYWSDIFNVCRNVTSGDVLEFGVGRGRSLISILAVSFYRHLKFNERKPGVKAFDSFIGFPEPSNEDESFRKPKKGEWAVSPNKSYEYSEEFLRNILQSAGIDDLSQLEIYPGYFEDTVHSIKERKPAIKILHLDGDLYQSVKLPLFELHTHVLKGGVIVIDDCSLQRSIEEEPFPGARKATMEFLETFPGHYELYDGVRGNPILIKL